MRFKKILIMLLVFLFFFGCNEQKEKFKEILYEGQLKGEYIEIYYKTP